MTTYLLDPQSDWFTSNLAQWEQFLLPLAGEPLNCLEIGCYEGRSSIWFAEHLLVHPDARLTCIDPWSGRIFAQVGTQDAVEAERRFRLNIKATGKGNQIQVHKAFSQDILPTLPPNSFDIIYADGRHTAANTLQDGVLSFILLKIGGILIFDDYLWRHEKSRLKRPKLAIDALLATYEGKYELLHKGYQVFLQKTEDVMPQTDRGV